MKITQKYLWLNLPGTVLALLLLKGLPAVALSASTYDELKSDISTLDSGTGGTIDISGTIRGFSAGPLPVITQSITFDGNGTAIIDGGGGTQGIFYVDPGNTSTTVTFSNLTIENGRAQGNDGGGGAYAGGGGAGLGGGLFINSGNVVLNSVLFSGNTAQGGAGGISTGAGSSFGAGGNSSSYNAVGIYSGGGNGSSGGYFPINPGGIGYGGNGGFVNRTGTGGYGYIGYIGGGSGFGGGGGGGLGGAIFVNQGAQLTLDAVTVNNLINPGLNPGSSNTALGGYSAGGVNGLSGSGSGGAVYINGATVFIPGGTLPNTGSEGVNDFVNNSGTIEPTVTSAVPWDISPQQLAIIGVPLFAGLRILKRGIYRRGK